MTDDDSHRLQTSAGRPGKGLTHEVMKALEGRLVRGEIKPGDKLPTESEIMLSFGVSRGVVREALSRLQAARLVQTQHGVGTFALEPHADGKFRLDSPGIDGHADLLQALELRTSIESDAAGLAANRRTDAHLADMRSALADFAANLSVVGETVSPDFRFHLAIAQATGNRYYSELMSQLGLAVIPRTRVSSSRMGPESREPHLRKVNQEHQDIYAAIERQDPEAARAAMRIHLVNSRERQRQAHSKPERPGDLAGI